MGFFEDDRIRRKNSDVEGTEAKQNEHYFKLELHEGVPVTRVVEALAESGLSIQLDRNNRIVVKE